MKISGKHAHKTRSISFCFFLFLFSFKILAQPANDLCSNATSLTVGAACTAGTNVGATTTAASDGVTGCWGTAASNTVWYQFTTGATAGTYVISTDNGTNTDTQIKLFTNCTGTLAPGTNCNDDAGINYSYASIIANGSLSVSTTYYIMVDIYGATTTNFCINVSLAPSNDLCANATPIAVGAPCNTETNVGATSAGDPTNQTCWTYLPSNSVWYSFVADDDSMTVDFGSGTLGLNTEGAVYTNCAATTLLGCTNNGTEIVLTTLTVGNTYYIMVDGVNTSTGTFCPVVFDTPDPNPPVGNSCSNPRTLYPYTACSTVTGAQYDDHDNQLGSAADTPGSSAGFANLGASPDPSCTANDNTQHQYWADFIATDVLTTFTDNDPTNAYPTCATALDYCVYTGSCGAFTQIDCFSLGGSCGLGCCNPVAHNVTTVVGTHYYVLITPTGAAAPGTDIRYLCITSATPSIPGNGVATDNCGSAPFITAGTTYTLNNANAGVAGTEPSLCVGSSENTLFVQWTAPAGWNNPTYVHLFNQDCNAPLGMQLSIYSVGTTCSTASPSCLVAENAGNTNDYTGSFTANPGSTYLIALDGNAGAGCTFNFLIDNLFVLPIELLYFDAKLNRSDVEISWTTSTETNNNYFTLEHSSDGSGFEEIKRINGAGTSDVAKNYFTVDTDPYSGINYYRLKQTDFNGKYTESKIISIKRETTKQINLYPNPAASNITMALGDNADNSVIHIYDVEGNLVYSKQVTFPQDHLLKIDVEKFEKGIYFVNQILNSGETTGTKFLKK